MRYSFSSAGQQVEKTIRTPALATEQCGDRLIVQKAISEQHL
jgi:hypothetical protein